MTIHEEEEEAVVAATLIPVTKSAWNGRVDLGLLTADLRRKGLECLARLGEVKTDLEMDVIEDPLTARQLLGFDIGEELVLVRFTAYVIPNDENKEVAYGRP